jgi:hypothetical protein
VCLPHSDQGTSDIDSSCTAIAEVLPGASSCPLLASLVLSAIVVETWKAACRYRPANVRPIHFGNELASGCVTCVRHSAKGYRLQCNLVWSTNKLYRRQRPNRRWTTSRKTSLRREDLICFRRLPTLTTCSSAPQQKLSSENNAASKVDSMTLPCI